MPILLNPKHERFVQELAQGKSAAEAYRAAGYEARGDSAKVNASRLLTDANVRARLVELQAEAAQRAAITLEGLLDRADRAFALAMRIEEPNAAVNAVKEMGILSGLRIEKRENENTNIRHVVSDQPFTAEEWEAEYGTAH